MIKSFTTKGQTKSVMAKHSRTFFLCSLFFLMLFFSMGIHSYSQEKRSFKVFQFPADMIPAIDGKTDDWNMVPDDYAIATDQLIDDRTHLKADAKNLEVKIKVGWVNGLNKLYFLYEVYDDYWDFSLTNLHNDIFELVVDGDQSGGPFIDRFHPNKNLSPMDAYLSFHGVHAQNYHIFTPPAQGKDWALAWGSSWTKNLPYANAAYNYKFKPGEPGKLILECWITPFDYAGHEGPERSVESKLYEDKFVGLSWAILDYDNVADNQHAFWNLSREHQMFGNASFALPFRLMPLEKSLRKPIEAKWAFNIIDMKRRLVSFIDQSDGDISSWKWDFGDGHTSAEQHPTHIYEKAGLYIVTLSVEGPAGTSRKIKIWEVVLK